MVALRNSPKRKTNTPVINKKTPMKKTPVSKNPMPTFRPTRSSLRSSMTKKSAAVDSRCPYM